MRWKITLKKERQQDGRVDFLAGDLLVWIEDGMHLALVFHRIKMSLDANFEWKNRFKIDTQGLKPVLKSLIQGLQRFL